MDSSPPTHDSFRITRPTLLVDKERCRRNIRKMADKAKAANVILRPHCKTHASLEIGKLLQEAGVTCITVSSLTMAKYFAASSSSFHDITVAFPVNILEMDTINEILSCNHSSLQLNLLVENPEAVMFLQKHLVRKVGIYIKIDVGYGRTGIPARDFDRIDQLLQCLLQPEDQPKLHFRGFLTHAGHSYDCHTTKELMTIHNASKELLLALKEQCQLKYPDTTFDLSIGDTPTCSVIQPSDLQGIQEIRPGNFVFYDVEQVEIGSCTFDEVAVAVACPIVAKHPDRRELILYGGGVHFSKDRLPDPNKPGQAVFGRVVRPLPGAPLTWGSVIEGMYLRSCSQEHGIVVVPHEEDFESYQIGDIVKVLPVHSCMTAAAMSNKGYVTCEGERISRMKD
jgi:D-serine deaminase-like pyridoxal phosphate-dependent protein